MKRVLPPFSAVRAFEAAARYGSFKQAADELHVTQSAISHQIKALEEFLNLCLFRRVSNSVELTETGRQYFDDVSIVLDQLDASTRRTRHDRNRNCLHIRSTPAFAARWLLKHVGAFNQDHPDVELKVTTSIETTDFQSDDVDLLIQYGERGATGLSVAPFMATRRVPVASPQLLAQCGALENPRDLLNHTLLRDAVGDDWQAWFTTAGVECPPDALRGPQFEHCDLTLRAAEQGQGIALAYEALIDQELATGTLVRLFDIETSPKVVYSITCPETWLDRPKVADFRDWLIARTSRFAGLAEPSATANDNDGYRPANPYPGMPRTVSIDESRQALKR